MVHVCVVHVCMIRSVCGSCVHDKECVWFMCA